MALGIFVELNNFVGNQTNKQASKQGLIHILDNFERESMKKDEIFVIAFKEKNKLSHLQA